MRKSGFPIRKLLLVAATPLETEIVRKDLGLIKRPDESFVGESQKTAVTLVHTGLGMMNTTWFLSRWLSENKPELSINFGIAGTYDPQIYLGDVVEISEEILGDLGADTPEGMLGLQEMGFPLAEIHGQKIYNRLVNPGPYGGDPKQVTGLSANLVSGRQTEIKRRYDRWPAQVETMESAAFFYAMLKEKVPFWAFRGISNRVEPRNRQNWQIKKANRAVQAFIIRLVKGYTG